MLGKQTAITLYITDLYILHSFTLIYFLGPIFITKKCFIAKYMPLKQQKYEAFRAGASNSISLKAALALWLHLDQVVAAQWVGMDRLGVASSTPLASGG